MSTEKLHFQQCSQPVALDRPDIPFVDTTLVDAEVSLATPRFSDLSDNDVAELACFFVIVAALGLALKCARGFLVRLPIAAVLAAIVLSFSVKWMVPLAVEQATSRGFYNESLLALDQTAQALRGLSGIERLPKPIQKMVNSQQTAVQKRGSLVIRKGIQQHVWNHDYDAAVSLASQRFSFAPSRADDEYRSAAHWKSSIAAHESEESEAALLHAREAHRYYPSEDTESLVHSATLGLAIANSDSEDIGSLAVLLDELPIHWRPQLQRTTFEYLGRRIFFNGLAAGRDTTSEVVAALVGDYERLGRRWWGLSAEGAREPSTVLACDLAGLYNIQGSVALSSGDTAEAVGRFRRSESLLEGGPYARDLLTRSLLADGERNLSEGRGAEAFAAFSDAFDRDTSQENACNVSRASVQIAESHGARYEYEAAHDSLSTAEKFCPELEQIAHTRAALYLSQGEVAMGKGEFGRAREYFERAEDDEVLGSLASNHRASIPHLQKTLGKLRSLRGIGEIPDIDGIVCSAGTPFCSDLILVEDGRQRGLANFAFTSMYFSDDRLDDNYVVLEDSNSDGYFDQWTYANTSSESVYYDYDRDHRPDWLSRYSENTLVEDRALSGVVSIRFSAAINYAADPAGEADAYLLVSKNGYDIGRTSTVRNNTYPTFPERLVIDYKFSDRIGIVVMDKDMFFDDVLGHAEIVDLPTTGYITTDRGRVGIALAVDPADEPEGIYTNVDQRAQVNPFEAPSWLEESSEMALLVQGARREQSRARLTANIASFLAPEAALALSSGPITIGRALVIGIVSHQVTYETLTFQSTTIEEEDYVAKD